MHREYIFVIAKRGVGWKRGLSDTQGRYNRYRIGGEAREIPCTEMK
jgi:hypothetical protein